jgi:hypothetical protein
MSAWLGDTIDRATYYPRDDGTFNLGNIMNNYTELAVEGPSTVQRGQ